MQMRKTRLSNPPSCTRAHTQHEHTYTHTHTPAKQNAANQDGGLPLCFAVATAGWEVARWVLQVRAVGLVRSGAAGQGTGWRGSVGLERGGTDCRAEEERRRLGGSGSGPVEALRLRLFFRPRGAHRLVQETPGGGVGLPCGGILNPPQKRRLSTRFLTEKNHVCYRASHPCSFC